MSADEARPACLEPWAQIRWDGKEPLLTVTQAAERLGIHTKTLRLWIKEGYVPVEKVGPRNGSTRVIPAVVRAVGERRRLEGLE